MSEPLTLPPCRVCGGTATGIHYGVNTCEACKAFFRRSLVENNKYVCPRDGDCKIINHKRANCSACRLKKCIDLGMSKKAVRHGRYTVAIRTKTILEVKQLEREQALKDSFAVIDSFAKQKLPEIISVPESAQLSDSSFKDTANSNLSTSFRKSSNLQSSLFESRQMTVNDATQYTIEQSSMSNTMTSLEPSSVFSSIDNKLNNDMFAGMDSLDIMSSLDLDINTENVVDEISGSDVFLNDENSQITDIDLTSDKIDFLEINSDELIDLTQEMIDVLPLQSTEQSQGQMVQHAIIDSTQQHSPQSAQGSSPISIQQHLSPDTTSLDESLSSQFGSQNPVESDSSQSSCEVLSVGKKISRTSYELGHSSDTLDSGTPGYSNVASQPRKKLRSSFNLTDDMEQLQLINTLVSAQEILYPGMRKFINKDYAEVIHKEFWEKTKLQEELFGHLKTLSNAEYNSFFLVTGMDIDGRMDVFTKAAECMQKEIVRYISFVKSIPGWEDLHNSDKLTLIKASRFEYWILGKFLNINPELGLTSDGQCSFTHKQILQMWGSPDNLSTINNFTKKLKSLDLTFEEIALLRGIVVLSRDRCALREPEVVEKMQWKILQALIHLIKKTHPHEPLRFARCMDKITQLRELTELNYKANKNLENFQKSLIQNFPLLYECVTFEG